MNNSDTTNVGRSENKKEPSAIKRKVILVNKPLQFKYMLLLAMVILILGGSISWHSYSALTEIQTVVDVESEALLGRLADTSPELSVEIFQKDMGIQINSILGNVKILLIIYLFVFLFIMTWHVLYMTHKLAGPLYRIEKSCQVVAKGDLSHRVQLRKSRFLSDDLGGFKDEFNKMIAVLQSMMLEDRMSVKDLSAKMERMARTVDVPEPMKKSLFDMKAQLDEITSKFKV